MLENLHQLFILSGPVISKLWILMLSLDPWKYIMRVSKLNITESKEFAWFKLSHGLSDTDESIF